MNVRLSLAFALGGVALLAVSCGSDSPSQPTEQSVVTVPPTTVPPTTVPPTTTPAAARPAPSPTPSCTQGLCETPTTNANMPVRLTIKLYKVVGTDGKVVPGINNDTKIPVGAEATVDATAKDEFGYETNGSGHVDFWVEDNGTVRETGTHDFQRKLKVLAAGTVSVQATLDGVRSNLLTLTLGK
jgi:hypothetical protein